MKITELLPLLRLHGRTITDTAKETLFMNWTCAGFTVAFTGSCLKARVAVLSDMGPSFPGFPPPDPDWPCLGAAADGSEELCYREELKEDGWVTLFSAEEKGSHTVRVVKLSENARGKLGIAELETDGEFIPVTLEAKPVIEFVGDSITCGFGNETTDGGMMFKTSEENGWKSYAALAARELGYEYSLISESGISASKPMKSFMPMHAMDEIYAFTDEMYDRKREVEPEKWDFAANPSKVVVINLGTNDATPIKFYKDATELKPMEDWFRDHYRGLIEQIRSLNGSDAFIVCTLGTMDYYLFNQIDNAVREYREATGDEKICAFKMVGINQMSEGMGGGGHPSLKTHIRMGHELATLMKQYVPGL